MKKDKSKSTKSDNKVAANYPAKVTSELFSEISSKVEENQNFTSTWENNQLKWYNLRMRVKKEKTFPFVGCSNVRMPTGDTIIKKAKASHVGTLFGVRPVVQAIPSPSGSLDIARKIEKFLDHLLMDVMDVRKKAIIAIDQCYEKGMYLLKPYWKVEITTRTETASLDDLTLDEAIELFNPEVSTDNLCDLFIDKFSVDRSDLVFDDNKEASLKALEKVLTGSETVTFNVKDVTYNFPDIALVSPDRFFVKPNSRAFVEDLECGTHEYYLPLRRIRANIGKKGWDSKAIEELNDWKTADFKNLTDVAKDTREGIQRLQGYGLVRIWEHYDWIDINNDGEVEKVCVTCAPDFHLVLKKVTLENFDGEWPFVKLFNELTDDRWFSHRGIIEQAEDIIKEIDIQHMQKIDQQTIRNTPQFLYRVGAINPNLLQFRLDQAIPVHGLQPMKDSIDVLNANNSNVEFSYDREEQILLGKIEEMVGQVNFNLQSQINRREPRTLGEVQLQYNSSQQVFSLDATILSDCFSKLFQKVFGLWSQYGPDDYEFNYFGDKKPERVKLTKEEIQGKYFIKVRANDYNSNPQVRLQKAQMILQMVSNPLAAKMGVVGPMQLAAAYRLAYRELDIESPEQFVMDAPQPTPQSPELPRGFETLASGEKAQILAKLGIQPDLAERSADKEHELMVSQNGRNGNGKK